MAKVSAPRSIADQVYEFIKKDILEGKLEPNSRLTQEFMGEFYQTSRTPVREAFRKLERDGLVERMPQGGVKVVAISVETIEEVYGVRAVLETYAVELACERISDSELERIAQIKKNAEAVLKSVDLSKEDKLNELLSLNSSFHRKINEASGNSYLVKILGEMNDSVMLGRTAGLRKNNEWSDIWKEHDKLINYLRKKDKVESAKLMRKHIESAAKNAIAVISRRKKETDKGS
ncbi:GntR family transcriptional regulator [Desulfosarcina widdelii]|uniref:GntR family transcriptional regulator n=1 Tax=Desulfosarcina widdelii TaxID=947919 RepID=A0A5K7Z3V9_9BACT|nr:GntR family transcriptional regulator [Desulfosarcina widdelii]BBO73164.1 GntR family transcriptional regulator [Desulfosarcina widdelii]